MNERLSEEAAVAAAVAAAAGAVGRLGRARGKAQRTAKTGQVYGLETSGGLQLQGRLMDSEDEWDG